MCSRDSCKNHDREMVCAERIDNREERRKNQGFGLSRIEKQLQSSHPSLWMGGRGKKTSRAKNKNETNRIKDTIFYVNYYKWEISLKKSHKVMAFFSLRRALLRPRCQFFPTHMASPPPTLMRPSRRRRGYKFL